MRWAFLFFPFWLTLWLVYLVLASMEGLMDGFPALIIQPIMGAVIAVLLAGGLTLLVVVCAWFARRVRRGDEGKT
jgi:hypothetical protein